jgi:hypothetical protein
MAGRVFLSCPVSLAIHVGKNMALPQSLRVSVTPPELELISCQQLVEIVPLISMEKTAFISVYIVQAKPTPFHIYH